MFKNKGLNLKKIFLQVILLQVCLAVFLTACAPADCSLQLLAGGSQYCEETTSGD